MKKKRTAPPEIKRAKTISVNQRELLRSAVTLVCASGFDDCTAAAESVIVDTLWRLAGEKAL